MMPLMLSIVMAQMPKQAPFLVRPLVSIISSQTMSVFVRPRLVESFGFVEKQLAGKEFFVGGGLTGADSEFLSRAGCVARGPRIACEVALTDVLSGQS